MAIQTTAIALKFVTLLLIDIVAFIGNALILLSGLHSPDLRKFNNAFIFNVAIADLCQSFFVIPFGLVSIYYRGWPLGNELCNVTAFLKVVFTLVSVQSLAGISLDRYFYIVKNKQAVNTKKRFIFCITIAWVNGCVLAISPFLGWGELGFDDGKEVCTILFYKTLSHTVIMSCVGLYIPVGVMAYCYYKIFKVLHVHGLKMKNGQHEALKTKKDENCHNISTKDQGQKEIENENLGTDREVKSHYCNARLISVLSLDKINSDIERIEGKKQPGDEKNVQGSSNDKNNDEIKQIDTRSGSNLATALTTDNFSVVKPSKLVPSENSKFSNEIIKQHDTKKSFRNRISLKLSLKNGGITQKELRLLNTILLAVSVFLSCWLPYVVYNTLRALSLVDDNNTIDAINMWMGFGNSALNPVIYGLTNRQFRNEMKKLLRKMKI